MTPRDHTSMGGRGVAFETTHWTEILRVQTADDRRRRELLGRILAKYWKPVYCFLRHQGHDNDTAKDLTQGFFQAVVVGRGLVQRADRSKGRFRTFLLTALRRYVVSVDRAAKASKRAPREGFLQLDGLNSDDLVEQADLETPEQAFDHAWAATLLDGALAKVKSECAADGKATHWAVFSARVLQPIMEDTEPPSLASLCAAHGIPNEMQASNMIVTVKRRFRTCLEEQVRQLVGSESEVGEEVRDLIQALSSSGAGH